MRRSFHYLLLALTYSIWLPSNAERDKQFAQLKSRHSPGVVLLYSKANVKQDKRSSGNLDERIINEDTKGPHKNGKQHSHGAPKPKCAKDLPYCLYDEEYPMDKVNDIVNNYYDDVHQMYYGMNQYPLKDYIAHDNYTHGYRHKGNFVCESEVAYVRPGWAKNWKNEWVAVVNTDKYPQSMRIETCKYDGMKCEYLPPCYKSFCVQRTTFVKLVCVDPFNEHHRPVVDVFEIPSACSCFVENFVYY